MHQSPDSNKKRLLLAEDNDFNQDIAIELLSNIDIEVDIANNGQEALEKLSEHGSNYYVMVLMDLEMPVLDGYQATIEIRQKTQFQHLPIIALTAHTKSGIEQRCLQIGMQGFLSKPFDPETLYAIVRKWLPDSVAREPHAPAKKLDISQWIHQIEGIDPRIALQSVAQNTQLLKQLLERFRVSQRKTLSQLAFDQLTVPVSQDFLRLIHSLKGTSATIGATTLSTLAATLELQLETLLAEKDHSKTLALISELKHELQSIVERLDHLLIQEPSRFTPSQHVELKATDSNTGGTMLRTQLLALLREADPEALEFFLMNQQSFRSNLELGQFKELENALNSYEFDKSTEILLSKN